MSFADILALLVSAKDDARDWANGRLWQWRLPLLAYLAYGGFKHLGDEYYATICEID